MIRLLKESDYEQVRKIHEKYYKHEFSLEEFSKNYLSMFAVVDNEYSDEIIVAGGIRTIVEVVLVTNKDFSARDRRSALYSTLQASSYMAKNYGYSQLHCFVQDEKWEKQLKKVGFHPTKGTALVIGV